jgi:hypothetical protein
MLRASRTTGWEQHERKGAPRLGADRVRGRYKGGKSESRVLVPAEGFSTESGVVLGVGTDRLAGTNGNRAESKEGKRETA